MSNLPKCDCLNHCGDDPWLPKGKAEYCDDFKEREKNAALRETIVWALVEDKRPDVNHLVLGFSLNTMKRVNECYFDGDVWRIHDSNEIWTPIAWANMPAGPHSTRWMDLGSKA